MSIPFPKGIQDKAWERQGGKCAFCGKNLVEDNKDPGNIGAWHAHHRKPTSAGGSQVLRNCVLLCINEPQYCHWKIGHDGRSWDYYNPLSDSMLPYLYAGQESETPEITLRCKIE